MCSAIRAENLLREMEYHRRTSSNNENNINPDLTTFNDAMKPWANSLCVGTAKATERHFFARRAIGSHVTRRRQHINVNKMPKKT